MAKDIYTGAIIPMTHALVYLYNRFKENPYGKVKWLNIKTLATALNDINEDYVKLNEKAMTIESINGMPTIISES